MPGNVCFVWLCWPPWSLDYVSLSSWYEIRSVTFSVASESISSFFWRRTPGWIKKNAILGSLQSFTFHRFILVFSVRFHLFSHSTRKLWYTIFTFYPQMTSKNLTTSSLWLQASSLQYKPKSGVALPDLPPNSSGRSVGFFPCETWGQGSLMGFWFFFLMIYLSGCIVGGFVHLPVKIPYSDCKTLSKKC